jgi:hypothetical protein
VPEELGEAGRRLVKGTRRQVDGVEVGAGEDGEGEADPELPPRPGFPDAGRPGAPLEPDTEMLTVFPLSEAMASASATPAKTASAAPIATSANTPPRLATRLDRACLRSRIRLVPAFLRPSGATPVAR